MSRHTQIALDFGPEPQSSSPAAAEPGGKVEEVARPYDEAAPSYMAAAGVGIRIKAYKQAPPAAQSGDLFDEPAANESVAAEPEAIIPAAEVATPEARVPEVRVPEVSVPEARIPEATTPEPKVIEPKTSEGKSPQSKSPEAKIPEAKSPQAKTPATKRPAVKQGPSKRGRKSLKQVAAEADLIEIPVDEVLFSKQYYTMGEVSEMFRVNQSLLRFWETEFDILQPRKNKKGDRYFRPIDIKNLHLIYHLLRQKKYTIEGAKEFLKKNKKVEERFEVIKRLEQIKAFLLEWKTQLE